MRKLPQHLLEARDEAHRRNLGWIAYAEADILVHSNEDPAGYTIPLHSHQRIQLLCVFSGVVVVATERGRWMIPPGHALLIPHHLEHSVEMLSDVSMRSVYLLPGEGVLADPEPVVLEVTDLARSLIIEAIRLREAPAGSRKLTLSLQLLMEEIASLRPRPLGLPFPSDRRLVALCLAYTAAPSANARLDTWAEALAMSRRTFTRFFLKETGVSFATWRQQASLFACLPKLAEGAPVTQIAMLAGYENVAAFTTMFRRLLGTSPRSYMKASISAQAAQSRR
ncbi:helix-turn-helix domain-containing protein [Bosea sp. 2KB_26]|uniref:AraC family transcriptional regulator n=1 Tax=Bosea sp. 2KB_26 TaxID=3237475 RepID=UPI003F90091B